MQELTGKIQSPLSYGMQLKGTNNVLQIIKISSNYIHLLPLELLIDRYAEVMAKHRLNDTMTEMLLYLGI